MKTMLPGKHKPLPKERDVQTIFPLKQKPQQVKDHEEKKR
jgi:hypothetical protein